MTIALSRQKNQSLSHWEQIGLDTAAMNKMELEVTSLWGYRGLCVGVPIGSIELLLISVLSDSCLIQTGATT